MAGTIENLSARLGEIRKQRSDLATERSDLYKEQLEVEHELLDMLSELGLDAAKTQAGHVRINENIVPKVDDWEQVYQYVVENNQPYILFKRISSAAYRELLNQGIQIPGTEPETLRTIGLTKR